MSTSQDYFDAIVKRRINDDKDLERVLWLEANACIIDWKEDGTVDLNTINSTGEYRSVESAEKSMWRYGAPGNKNIRDAVDTFTPEWAESWRYFQKPSISGLGEFLARRILNFIEFHKVRCWITEHGCWLAVMPNRSKHKGMTLTEVIGKCMMADMLPAPDLGAAAKGEAR